LRYLALLYWEEDRRPSPASPGYGEVLAGYAAANRSFREAGVMLGANALENVESAVTVKLRDGARIVTDGPFAETKERLGGYYLFDCADMAEALDLAARIPAARYGTIEVRPVLELDMPNPE
jgi:hypothetical protein